MRTERTGIRYPGRGVSITYVTLLALAIVVPIPGTGESQEVGAVQAVRGGTGNGTIVSDPAGIDSRFDSVTGVATGSSAASFPAGTRVTLTALPLAGWSFAGWSGDQPDCGDGVVMMFEAKLCGATFVPGATGLATAEALIR